LGVLCIWWSKDSTPIAANHQYLILNQLIDNAINTQSVIKKTNLLDGSWEICCSLQGEHESALDLQPSIASQAILEKVGQWMHLHGSPPLCMACYS
jgi:hypothetical protein